MGKTAKDRRINSVLSVVLTIVCILWMYPVFMILMNSLKTERAITTTHAFELPTAETFVGLKNYIYGIAEMDFLSSLWYSFIITISSVALILLCCSMCAWYITRVQGVLSKGMYYLCVFSMIVPFQMVMFTLAKTADTLKLNNPYNICIIYLGFGAGLQPAADLFQSGLPHPEADDDLHCHPGNHVGLERLPAAHAGAGHQAVPYHSHGHPVFPRQLRQGRDGPHDGLHYDHGHPRHCAVPGLPEVHHRRCCGRCG